MADLARRGEFHEPSEADYDEFCATVMASARGRWFLTEYAKRHRTADTEAALAALRRIESNIRGAAPSPQFDRLRDELRAILAIVREGRADLSAADGALSKAQKIMALLDLLESRLTEIVDARRDNDPPAMRNPESPRPYLTVVPPPQEPVVEPRPAPQDAATSLLPEIAFTPPAPAAPPPVTQVKPLPVVEAKPVPVAPAPKPEPVVTAPQVRAAPAAAPAARPDMFPAEIFAPATPGAPIEPTTPAPAIDAQPQPAVTPAAPRAAPKPDVIAEIMALSEEERIAFFT